MDFDYLKALELVPDFLSAEVYYSAPKTLQEVHQFLKHELLSFGKSEFSSQDRGEIGEAMGKLDRMIKHEEQSVKQSRKEYDRYFSGYMQNLNAREEMELREKYPTKIFDPPPLD